MKDTYTREDLQNPEELSDVLERAKTQVFGPREKQIQSMTESRDRCQERGYHRVSEEKDDLMICYDCELWFDKQTAESCGWKYKVEPL